MHSFEQQYNEHMGSEVFGCVWERIMYLRGQKRVGYGKIRYVI